MIVIQEDIWRADYIVGFGWDGPNTFQIWLSISSEPFEYEFNTPSEALAAYKTSIEKWKLEIEAQRTR